LKEAFGTGQGYLKSLTRPKSSAVASTVPSGALSQALTSVPSAQGGKIPWTGHPRVQVHVFHVSSLKELAPLGFYFPVATSKNKIS
jgi:hypothetical protein